MGLSVLAKVAFPMVKPHGYLAIIIGYDTGAHTPTDLVAMTTISPWFSETLLVVPMPHPC